MTHIVVEVCIDSVESAMNAIRGGANRLELCGNLGLGGGTTPSLGLLKTVYKAVESFKVPIMVMIRCRTGDFFYSESEMQVMLEDIRIFRECGVKGFVFGVLTGEGRVDVARTKRLVDASFPAQVCFHRAFDMTRDAMEAFNDIKKIGGISRILTSGQGFSVSQSLQVLASLLEMTGQTQDQLSSPIVMPGSGIDQDTIGHILVTLLPLGLAEIHLSAGSWVEGGMTFRKDGMRMGVGGKGDWGIWQTSENVVREVINQVESNRARGQATI
ncbi:copper homeostasis CutC domain-containing protein [Lentinula aciculospora]|uniref:Copper homeostasis protein cutC homolog n=1 Tax=Lentinula aciculospora TaxID=153920 RepID=A0A9W9DTH4_9AGAR|nr:copper homeostasis CutC domain-containing protein [Lentinula aciculospora]